MSSTVCYLVQIDWDGGFVWQTSVWVPPSSLGQQRSAPSVHKSHFHLDSVESRELLFERRVFYNSISFCRCKARLDALLLPGISSPLLRLYEVMRQFKSNCRTVLITKILLLFVNINILGSFCYETPFIKISRFIVSCPFISVFLRSIFSFES